MENKKGNVKSSSIYGCSSDNHIMKRSPSELALEEFFASTDDDRKMHDQKLDQIFGGPSDHHHHHHHLFGDDQLRFPSKYSDIPKESSGAISLADKPLWSKNIYPNQSNLSATIDSQSSICVDSPMSGSNPTSHDRLSDEEEEDLEIEQGTNNLLDVKRIKRMAEQLRRENAILFKQLADSSQQLKDSTTNHRILKSDVEALRAKVKLAEDMVSRGSLTSSLSHLLQSYLNAPGQDYMSNNISCTLSPLVSAPGDDHNSPYSGTTTDSNIGLDQNAEHLNSNVPYGVMSEVVDRMPEIWTWESHVPPK
ncbi:hypothetical protein OROHE_013571 [Orobanche hederae]